MAKTKKTKDEPTAVELVLAKYGDGAIQSKESKSLPVDVIPTGSIGLDAAIGVAGWPRGRICEIYGPESSGKSTMCLHAIAEAQKLGLKAAYIDAEHAMDLGYAKALGVDTETLDFAQPDYGEQALEIVDILVRSGEYGIVVVDSVAALTPKAELDGEFEDRHVGGQARMMSTAMRKLAAAAHKGNTLLLFVNQTRAVIGGFGHGPKTTTCGGNALKFFSSVRVDLRRIGSVKTGEVAVANRTRAKIAKNKMSRPFQEVEFDIEFGLGVDRMTEIMDRALAAKVISLNGSWVVYNEKNLANGRVAAKKYFRENPEVLDEIYSKVLAKQESGHSSPKTGK